MQYTLNGKDIQLIFGVTISDGAATLLQFPKRKDSVTNNWLEEDGIDKDLADPHFEARQFKFTCTLLAKNREEFKNKFYGLFSELKKQYSQTLYSADLDQAVHLYYVEMQNLRKLSYSINAGQVGVVFDLLFGEVNPNDNIPVVYLVDEDENYLIA